VGCANHSPSPVVTVDCGDNCLPRSGAILEPVTTPTLELEPDCPETAEEAISVTADHQIGGGSWPLPGADSSLVARRVSFDHVPRDTWDGLVERTPAATPFSRWAFHRAWWDGYGATAHDETLLIERRNAGPQDSPVGIVPLMHRHEVEPTDVETRSTIRHGHDLGLTPVAPTAKAIFFGASYHADYATILSAPEDLPGVVAATVSYLARPAHDPSHPAPWDVVDLRRLRCADPAADALKEAFEAAAPAYGWWAIREREDVCPALTLPEGVDFDGFLATLGKKTRHEIRRKIRRAEAAGEVALVESTDPLRDLDVFIQLHQRRWGDAGLFPATPGGAASRRFIYRLFEAFGPRGPGRLSFLTVGGRRIGAGIHLDDGETIAYYNAGTDPDARDLSPGVILIARYVMEAIALGRRRFDFLRGDEPYKYEWGAVDEPIQRILVCRPGM
jgi:CelD/BcsL family acetyltransferase involved in cellulose biosynthesis